MPLKSPRRLTDMELALELAQGDPKRARTYLEPIHAARRIQVTLLRALEGMRATRAGDIVGSEVQTSAEDSTAVQWVDWFESARKTLDDLLQEAP